MRLFNLWHRVRWGAEPQCSTDVWSWMSTKNKRRYGSEAAWYFLKWSEATTLCDKQRTLESLQLQAEPWIRGARYVTMSFWCHCMEHLQHNSRWYRGILEVLHFWTHLIWGFSWRASPTSRCLGHLIIKICCANRRCWEPVNTVQDSNTDSNTAIELKPLCMMSLWPCWTLHMPWGSNAVPTGALHVRRHGDRCTAGFLSCFSLDPVWSLQSWSICSTIIKVSIIHSPREVSYTLLKCQFHCYKNLMAQWLPSKQADAAISLRSRESVTLSEPLGLGSIGRSNSWDSLGFFENHFVSVFMLFRAGQFLWIRIEMGPYQPLPHILIIGRTKSFWSISRICSEWIGWSCLELTRSTWRTKHGRNFWWKREQANHALAVDCLRHWAKKWPRHIKFSVLIKHCLRICWQKHQVENQRTGPAFGKIQSRFHIFNHFVQCFSYCIRNSCNVVPHVMCCLQWMRVRPCKREVRLGLLAFR